jgi:hypothetical protein
MMLPATKHRCIISVFCNGLNAPERLEIFNKQMRYEVHRQPVCLFVQYRSFSPNPSCLQIIQPMAPLLCGAARSWLPVRILLSSASLSDRHCEALADELCF